jgi:hypothetical protein
VTYALHVRAVLVLALMSCGGGSTPSTQDAPDEPLLYRLNVFSAEPFDRPLPNPPPVVFIDGVATKTIERTFENLEAASTEVHEVELRQGLVVIARLDIHPVNSCEVGRVTRFVQDMCMFESGDLRYFSDGITGTESGCTGDSFCMPRCFCAPDERCTSRIVLLSPVASHLGCAPIGPKQEGEGCSLISDPEGDFDDCGASLLCVDATCHALCTPAIQGQCATGQCNYVPGHDPTLGVCN